MIAATIATAVDRGLGQSPPLAASASPERVEEALAAFAVARDWLDEFDPPPMDDDKSRVALDDASAVCVILRRGGRMMGVGIDDAGDALMLRRALGRAMNQSLADPALQSLASAMREERALERIDLLRRDLGRTLTLELEIAAPRTPLVGTSLAQIAGRINAGAEGVSLRHGRRWSHAFPAQQRLTNAGLNPEQTVTALAIDVGLGLAELGEITSRQDVGVYAFSTIDLLQADPVASPEHLFRGERLVLQEHVSRDVLMRRTAALVRHILARQWPQPPEGQPRLPLGLMGDYNPAADQHQPMTGPALEQALCAWALVRYAQSAAADTELAKDAALGARTILRDLAQVMPGEEPATHDPGACAALLTLAAAMPSIMSDAAVSELLVEARGRLNSVFQPDKGFHAIGADGAAMSLTPSTQALIALAWVRLHTSAVDLLPAPPLATIRAALDAIWDATPPSQHVALLPWIGWAEREFAAAAAAPLAHMKEMRHLISALEEARIGGAADVPDDLRGGFALTGGAASAARPSAQSLRPAAWMASAVRDSNLVAEPVQAAAWQGHLSTVRFACQLQVSDIRAAACRNASRSIGGICASPWELRQPLAAQAMGVWAMVETIENWRN